MSVQGTTETVTETGSVLEGVERDSMESRANLHVQITVTIISAMKKRELVTPVDQDSTDPSATRHVINASQKTPVK